MKLRLQTRYSLVVVGLLLAMLGAMVAAHLAEFRSVAGTAARSVTDTMTAALFEQVRKQGRGLAQLLADTLADPIYRLEVHTIRDVVRAARRREGVLYVAVYDDERRLLSTSPDNGPEIAPSLDAPFVREALESGVVASSSDGRILHLVAPVMAGRRPLGCVKVGLSLAGIGNDIDRLGETLRTISRASERRFLEFYVVVAVVVVGIGLVLSLVLVRGLVRPIRALSRYTRRIGAGRYEAPPPVERSDELGDLARALGRMARDLKQAEQVSRLATLGEMAVGMAHELNQPLNTIRLAAENALEVVESREPDREFEAGKLRLISQQAAAMGDLIQRMGIVGRSEGPREPVDPRDAVHDAVRLLGGQLEDEGILVTLNVPDSCAPVLGRRNELAQVMMNLLTNARDAIVDTALGRPDRSRPTGGRIEVSVEESGESVLIRVKDNGGGIPPDVIDRVFDPFFTTKGVTKGTGLGLSISYGIVNAMGGRLSAENFGGGALFTVRLPQAGGAAGERGDG